MDLSLSFFKKKKGTIKRDSSPFSFFCLAFSLHCHLSPHPSIQSSPDGKKRGRERERGMGRGAERHYAYENVLKEVWFMYALDADSITGQWLKWDLSRNTEATWSDSVSLLAIWATGKLLTEERKKRERRHIYNLNTHTSPTGRE